MNLGRIYQDSRPGSLRLLCSLRAFQALGLDICMVMSDSGFWFRLFGCRV